MDWTPVEESDSEIEGDSFTGNSNEDPGAMSEYTSGIKRNLGGTASSHKGCRKVVGFLRDGRQSGVVKSLRV